MKLNFAEVLEALHNEQFVQSTQVKAKALNRKVWVAEWHIPGCLSESQFIALTKKEAIEAAKAFAEDDGKLPCGFVTALQREGCFQHKTGLYGRVITTIFKTTIANIL